MYIEGANEKPLAIKMCSILVEGNEINQNIFSYTYYIQEVVELLSLSVKIVLNEYNDDPVSRPSSRIPYVSQQKERNEVKHMYI